jgi:hypothetical protein
MTIQPSGYNSFLLKNESGIVSGTLLYTSEHFQQAVLYAAAEYHITHNQRGAWITCEAESNKEVAVCKVGISGTITLQYGGKIYQFKKPHSWKPRFVLLNSDKEEIAALLPTLNWEIKGYDFILQLNEEFSGETDAFIILQALHCAVCSLAMINGQLTPVVITGNT